MEYKAAVILNNMAVSMAMRRCYDQAFRTMKDATVLVKAAFRKNVSNDKVSLPSDVVGIQPKLQQAYKRSSNPSKSARIVNMDLVSHSFLFEAKNCTSSRSAFQSLIRIETDDQELLDHKFHVEFSIAVILYNYAIFGLCVVINSEWATFYHDGAVKLLALSANILSKLYERLSNEEPENDVMTPLVLRMSTTLLNKLVEVFTISGRDAEAQSCATTLSFLVKASQDEAGNIESLKKRIAAAAA